jgi:hypothetical protein
MTQFNKTRPLNQEGEPKTIKAKIGCLKVLFYITIVPAIFLGIAVKIFHLIAG